jgi:hypothetical protein
MNKERRRKNRRKRKRHRERKEEKKQKVKGEDRKELKTGRNRIKLRSGMSLTAPQVSVLPDRRGQFRQQCEEPIHHQQQMTAPHGFVAGNGMVVDGSIIITVYYEVNSI